MNDLSQLCPGLLFFAALALEITAFQWSPSSLDDNAYVYGCPGTAVTLGWSYTTNDSDFVHNIQWYAEKDGQPKEIIATFTAKRFFTEDPNLLYDPPAGLQFVHFYLNNSGTYFVCINVQNTARYCFANNRSTVVSLGIPPDIADGQLQVRQRPGAWQDEVTGEWFVQLECGYFLSLGQPPATVRWTSPSGRTYNSSSFDLGMGTFVLNLTGGIETGEYSCALDNTRPVGECQELHQEANASVEVDANCTELLYRNYQLQAEINKLRETTQCSVVVVEEGENCTASNTFCRKDLVCTSNGVCEIPLNNAGDNCSDHNAFCTGGMDCIGGMCKYSYEWLKKNCTTDADCSASLSECFKRECLCSPGYYYSNSSNGCVDKCAATDLSDTFLRYSQSFLNGGSFDVLGTLHGQDVDTCLSSCGNHTQCRLLSYTGQYNNGTNVVCVMYDAVAAEASEAWDSDLYQRGCN